MLEQQVKTSFNVHVHIHYNKLVTISEIVHKTEVFLLQRLNRPVAVGVAMQLILLTAAMLEDHKIAKMYCALYFFILFYN